MNQDEWSDAAIAAGLRRQDPTALEAIVVRYSREIFYFIRMVLSNVGALQDVEECVNDLFVSVWQECDAFDATRGSFRTWLTMRAKYLALDRRRHLLRRHVATVDLTSFEGETDMLDHFSEHGDHSEHWRMPEQWAADSLDAVVVRREEHAQLHQALARLPALDRQLMYLRYFRLKSTEDIAAQTGLSKHAIDTRLWRARKQLKATLWEPSHGRV